MNHGINKLKLFRALYFPLMVIFAASFFAGQGWAKVKKTEPVSDMVISEPKPVEDIEFLDGAGETRKLSESEGNVRIVNFWALWCFPCKEEMPSLAKLQADYKDKGLKIIPLANGTDGAEQIKNFYKKNHIDALDIFIDDGNKNFKTFTLKGLPTSIIINKKGEEVARISGYNDWESKKTKDFIEKLLAE